MIVNIKDYQVEVDEEDVHIVNGHGWCLHNSSKNGRFYFQANVKGKRVLLHRMIMNAPKGQDLDHADGNTLNNRKRNLRFSTTSQNLFNRGKQRNNTSGFKGVTRNHKRWMAQMEHMGKLIYLGTYDTPMEAGEAYKVAAIRIAGEFARW